MQRGWQSRRMAGGETPHQRRCTIVRSACQLTHQRRESMHRRYVVTTSAIQGPDGGGETPYLCCTAVRFRLLHCYKLLHIHYYIKEDLKTISHF